VGVENAKRGLPLVQTYRQDGGMGFTNFWDLETVNSAMQSIFYLYCLF
jgi:hypothetical protein